MALWSHICAWFSISTVHWAGTYNGSVSLQGLAVWESDHIWAGNGTCNSAKSRWKCSGLPHWCLIPDFEWLKWLCVFWVVTVSGSCDFSNFKHHLKRKIEKILLYCKPPGGNPCGASKQLNQLIENGNWQDRCLTRKKFQWKAWRSVLLCYIFSEGYERK